jgi:hypothetical protein
MKAVIFLLLAGLGCIGARAQHSSFMPSYPISFTTGDLHNYTSQVSFRGVSLDFNRMISHESSAGLEVGWNVFYQHVSNQVYKDGTASISGVQYRYTNAAPIIAGLKYYKHTNSKMVSPYVGLGAGTVYVDRTTNFGLYQIRKDAWQFCLRPELGLDLRFAPDEAMFIAAKYFWDFSTSQLEGQTWLSVNIGFRVSM